MLEKLLTLLSASDAKRNKTGFVVVCVVKWPGADGANRLSCTGGEYSQ